MPAFPDLFGLASGAREQAQRDFADKLAMLYASGNMQSGQQLAGLDPARADQIRMALEKMPESEHRKAIARADTLKKWLFAIDNEPDEAVRPLLWNKMLGSVQEQGGDISSIPQDYSRQALTSATNSVMSFAELAAQAKEKRLASSQGGDGTENERKIALLTSGDPNDPEWRQNYIQTFLVPKTMYNPVTGRTDSTYVPADPVIARKAISVGLGVNEPTRQVMSSMPGEITAPGSDINGQQVQQTAQKEAPEPPKVVVQGPEPGMSRAEKEKIAAEDRARQRQIEEENRKAEKEAELGTQYTMDQQKSAGFAARMDQAAGILSSSPNYVPSVKDIAAYKYDPTGVAASDDYKKYRQAQENWISANLRRESGAVIGVDEMEQEIKKYFPMPNDPPEILRQKAESRRIAEAGMRQSAGGAYKQLKQAVGDGRKQVSTDKKQRAGF